MGIFSKSASWPSDIGSDVELIYYYSKLLHFEKFLNNGAHSTTEKSKNKGGKKDKDGGKSKSKNVEGEGDKPK